MKISHIIAVSICGIAWALYGILAQTTLCDSIPNKDAVFFVFPSPGKILLTLTLAQIFVYSLWLGISFLKNRNYNLSNKDALQSAAISIYPSFFLFLLTGILTPYIKIFYMFSAFFLDLGPVFPCIILALILLKNLKPELTPSPGKYTELSTPLKIKRDVTDIEFRIHYLENADVSIDKIDIIVK